MKDSLAARMTKLGIRDVYLEETFANFAFRVGLTL
jgi:hypothetical protein